MGEISKGVANTLEPNKKYKKIMKSKRSKYHVVGGERLCRHVGEGGGRGVGQQLQELHQQTVLAIKKSFLKYTLYLGLFILRTWSGGWGFFLPH
jgi:hypothetical protein